MPPNSSMVAQATALGAMVADEVRDVAGQGVISGLAVVLGRGPMTVACLLQNTARQRLR